MDSLRGYEGDHRRNSSSELHDFNIFFTGVTSGGKGRTGLIPKEAKYKWKLEYAVYFIYPTISRKL